MSSALPADVSLLRSLFASTFVLLIGSVAALIAQDQDPFGAAAPKVEAPPKKGSPATVIPDSVAAQAVLSGNPTTVIELARAIDLLAQLREFKAAEPLVKKLVASKPDAAAQVAAFNALTSQVWLRLTQYPEFPPELAKFADGVIKTAGQEARKPERLKKLITNLIIAKTDAEQTSALIPLLGAGDAGTAACLGALTNDKLSAIGRARLQQVILESSYGAKEPLIAALQSPSAEVRTQALGLLGECTGKESLPWLVGPALDQINERASVAAQAALQRVVNGVPAVTEASTFLRQHILSYLNDELRFPLQASGRVSLWMWDIKQQQPVEQLVSQSLAQASRAAQLSDDLLRLTPDDNAAQQLWLRAQLSHSALRTGLDQPALLSTNCQQQIERWGASSLEQLLTQAIKDHDPVTATAAARALALTGPRLSLTGPTQHPLVLALRYPNRRLQFAAAQTLVKFAPRANFNGLGHLIETLKHLATNRGERAAVVGFPNPETSTRLTGYLNQAKLVGHSAVTGRQVVLAAQQSADVELVLISTHVNREPLSITIQELRRDPRTAHLPIVILTEETLAEPRMTAIYANDPLVMMFARPFEPTVMEFLLQQTEKKVGQHWVTPAERAEHGKFALTAMLQLQQLNPQLFDFQDQVVNLAQAFETSALSESAAGCLAVIGNHRAQQTLLEFANRRELPTAQRALAVTQLGEAVRRHGVQLTRNEVLRQYDLYNASAKADVATQKLLGTVLDVLELPASVAQPATNK